MAEKKENQKADPKGAKKATKKDNDYFGIFVEMVEYSCLAARNLQETLNNFDPEKLPDTMRFLHHIEHTADIVKHDMMTQLVKEFITPIEREDIMEMAQQIDNVTDCIEDVLMRIYMYNIKTILPEALEFADTIVKCCDELKKIVEEFPHFRKSTTIHGHIVQVNYLEEVGDKIYTEAVHTLYSTEHTVLEIIGWTETFERLEKCCDACEDVADVVESVIMKNA